LCDSGVRKQSEPGAAEPLARKRIGARTPDTSGLQRAGEKRREGSMPMLSSRWLYGRALFAAFAVAILLAAPLSSAEAKSYGFATLPPGTLNYTTASAIAKVLEQKAGLNVLVQPTAGDDVIIPMVGRGEATIGITNILEIARARKNGGEPNLRLIGRVHALRTACFVRKDSAMKTIADLKGKRVTLGFSAMPTISTLMQAILATGGLTEKDVTPVLVPNVVRSADDFVNGSSDMFFFAFGAPKVREVDATIGGIRALTIDAAGMAAARKITPYGYLTTVKPGPAFIGIDHPMSVYSFDNLLITNADAPPDLIYKVIETLVKYKADVVAIQPVLREFSAANMYVDYGMPYHPGALKYFEDHHLSPEKLR
jgi:TRAP transporter TAXI family solute receptor